MLNVWLLRSNRPTQWRGAGSASLKEEFEAYGLSIGIMKTVGTVKILLSLLIIASLFYKPLENISVTGMAVMMLGAIAMHIKIKDHIKRSFPALFFLILSLAVLAI